VTSTLVGASSVAQLGDNLGALDKLAFSDDEPAEIDQFAREGETNLWAASSQALSSSRTRATPSGAESICQCPPSSSMNRQPGSASSRNQGRPLAIISRTCASGKLQVTSHRW
jgi:hypothetical protein